MPETCWYIFFRTLMPVGFFLVGGCSTPPLQVPAARVAVQAPSVVTNDESGSGADPLASSPAVSSVASTSSDSFEKPGPTINIISAPPPPWELPKRPDLSSRFSSTNALTVAVEGMPAKNFLSYVLGELLKVNYLIVEGTAGLDEPVTFNAQRAVSSKQLFRLINELLSARGIGIVERESTFFVGPADAKTKEGVQIGYGRNATDVPDVVGEILQIIPVNYGPNYTLTNTAQSLTNLKINPDTQWNAYFVTGSRADILKFLDLVKLFDRPLGKASKVGILSLTYMGADEFASQVTGLLEKEGITLGGPSPMTLVPLNRLGAVVVFASSDEMLGRLEFWAKQLDRPGEGPTRRYFVYQPQFARAWDLGESIASLLGVSESVAAGNLSRDTRSALGGDTSRQSLEATAATALRRDARAGGTGGGGGSGPITASGNGVTLSIDSRSNSLIFYTTGPEYEALLPMIRRLDVSPKQVVLEAMIAEVSLTGEFANGVEFAFRDGKLSGGTAGGLGLSSGGLALTFNANVADQIRLRLQASDTRVNVLSSPMLVVKDGVAATIQVGNDVPTVGATASNPTESDRLVTTVLYRKTGLNLSITPNINAQGAVLLKISQSTVSTVPGSSGVSGAPIFFERAVDTEVVALSGQTVFLAGLRSESDSATNARTPVVGRVPLIGALFRSDTKRREKTELVVLITPRVIEGLSEWTQIMKGLSDSLTELKLPALEDQSGSVEPKSTR